MVHSAMKNTKILDDILDMLMSKMACVLALTSYLQLLT